MSPSPGGQLPPDVFGGCLAVPLDGGALIFVVQPGGPLAGPVAVVGELALAAAVEPLLAFEAGVADDVCQAGRTEGHTGSCLGDGAAPPRKGPAHGFLPPTQDRPPDILGGHRNIPPGLILVRLRSEVALLLGYAKEANILFKGGRQ